jgi:periplasmic protein CpxP/Spy
MRIFTSVRSMLVMVAVCMAAVAAGAQAQTSETGIQAGFGERQPPMERTLGSQGQSGHWWNNQSTVDKLKLTDAQRKSMDDVLLQHREKLVDLRGNVEKAELVLEPLMREDQPNETKILAQIDKLAQARAELEKANARFLLAIRGKLTPEQWKQLQAERASHQQQRGNWERGGQNGRGQGGMMKEHQQLPTSQAVPQGAAVPQGTDQQGSDMRGGEPQGTGSPSPVPQGTEAPATQQ